jgi:hypothetical protein
MMHTLTCDDPSNYHVLQRWKSIVLKNNYDEATVHYGLQDGIPVAGYSYRHGPYKGRNWGGGGCAPGRKWGEYPTIDHAILETLLWLRTQFERPQTLALIDKAIRRYFKPIQLELF